jgi:phage shock protein PspC (stress-responsive transcriptional regulator)
MNKIISISINGIVFNVDEHAYLTLKNYLDALKVHFAGTEGSEEILGDIEARIAEMLLERMKTKREVVTAEDVAAVMNAMGTPEDMGEAEGTQQSKSANSSNTYERTHSGSRRVFRNPDDKVLGGVCSGVANYFDIDPLIPRLIFVVAFFGFGSGLLLYIILWIIIPEAKTPSEKLEMKGERVNVSNIEKTVKENLNDFKTRVNEWGDEIKKTDTSKIGNFFTSLAKDFVRALKPLLMILVKIAAFFLLGIAAIILFALIISLLGFWGVITTNMPAFMYDIFDTKNDMVFGSIGFVLLLGIPVIALLYYALRVIFNIKYSNKWIGLSLAIAWLAGIGLVAVTSVRAINKFGHEETLVENAEINHDKQQPLYLLVNKSSNEKQLNLTFRNHHNRGPMRIKIDKNEMMSNVVLDIEKSESGKMELVKEFTAHGRNNKEAQENASKIIYAYTQNDSQLIFDEIFNLEKGNKWRAQEVKLTLKVPVGQTIIMKPGMESIIYDIDNTTHVYDRDMIGRKWLMTENGLSCLDCPAENKYEHDDYRDDDDDWRSKESRTSYQTTMVVL